MFADLRTLENGAEFEADICVIGAGPAGISLALEFIGTPTRVLLVESGGFEPEAETQALYEGANLGLPYFDLSAARVRCFGGSSNHWDNWCGELTPIDYRRREWVPYSGWPINGEQMAPFYLRARPLCGIRHARPAAAIWQDLRTGPLPVDRAYLDHRFWEFGGPTRFGVSYRPRLERADNIRILLHANATEVQTSDNGSEVKAVTLQTLDGKRATVRAQRYVLACGGIDNARLLLASKKVERQGVGNQHDLVGRFFMEHTVDTLGTVVTQDPHALISRFGSTWVGKTGYTAGLALSDRAQEREKLLGCSFMLGYSAKGDAISTLKQMAKTLRRGRVPDRMAAELWSVVEDVDMLAYNLYRRQWLGLPLLPKAKHLERIHLVSHNEQEPNPDSRVTLADEKDAVGMPRAALDWRTTSLDKRSAVYFAKAIGAEMARVGAGVFRLEPWIEDSSDAWSDGLIGGFHHIGTTRMAEDEKQGVVDANCRVHNMENLYIAGSSVFPTSANINPTLTLVALALRLADHLKAPAVRRVSAGLGNSR